MSIKDELEALHGAAKDIMIQVENLAHSVGVNLHSTDGERTNGAPATYETATDYLLRRFTGVDEVAVAYLRDLKRTAFQISQELGDGSRIEDSKGTSFFRNDVLSRAFGEVFFHLVK